MADIILKVGGKNEWSRSSAKIEEHKRKHGIVSEGAYKNEMDSSSVGLRPADEINGVLSETSDDSAKVAA